MNKIIVPIKGMHCRSCEILISEKIREIPGINGVSVNYKKSQAVIYSKQQINKSLIENAIRDAGYTVGVDDSKSWISLNISDYRDLVLAGIILTVLYLIAKKLGISSISVGSGNSSSLLVVLLIGLTAGISTCMALVGGLILGISARYSEKHPEATPIQKFRPHLFFNLGRISSYFIFGGLIGLIGKAFQFSGTFLGLLIIIVGLTMLVLGLQLTALFPRLSSVSITLSSSISKLFRLRASNQKEYSHKNSILMGALTFFLPCGFTQAMQLYAMSTGSFLSGALIMGTFALGTAPGLLGVGGLTSVIRGNFAKLFYKFTGLLVIILAIINIGNGYNLTGWHSSAKSSNQNAITQNQNDPNVQIVNGVQEVRMDQVGNGYKPNKFTIQKNIPVKWIINSKNDDVCAASIVMNKMGINKSLVEGENITEFTPSEVGDLNFSCFMGMYTGKFIVVDN